MTPEIKTEELHPKRKGLSPKHHLELNDPYYVYPGGFEAKKKRLDELRQEYADDELALQQIDAYDSETELHIKLREYTMALKTQDEAAMTKLEEWFNTNYQAFVEDQQRALINRNCGFT